MCTIERWREYAPGGEDRRAGLASAPANALSPAERARILEVTNSPESRDLPHGRIAPRLADRGEYVASESSMYRDLREASQSANRGQRGRPRGGAVLLARFEALGIARSFCGVWVVSTGLPA